MWWRAWIARPRRPAVASRWFRAGRGVNAGVLTLFVVGILVLVNVLAARHPLRMDLSPDRRFGLAPQSRDVLARLAREQQPVRIYAFVQDGTSDAEPVEDLLREYHLASRRVQVEVVDPEKQPSLAREMDVRAFGTVVVELGGRRRKIEPYNLFSPDPTGMGMQFRGEQAITRALMELGGDGGAVIYFTEGHGEASPLDDYSELRNYLEGEGYTVRTVNLATRRRVPEDARILVMGGPRTDLVSGEREAVAAYLAGGGRLAVWVDPVPGRDFPQLRRLLAEGLGVELLPGIVVDPGRALFGDPLSPIPEMRWHDVTRPLIQANMGMVLPGARAMRPMDRNASPGQRPQARAIPLLLTTEQAWAETQPVGQRWNKDPGDAGGPLEVALAIERAGRGAAVAPAQAGAANGSGGPAGARPVAVLVGNSTFARNASLSFQGNLDFAANALSWLAGLEDRVSVRPRSTPVVQVSLTGTQAEAIFYGTAVGMPLAVLLLGIGVWWRRRSL